MTTKAETMAWGRAQASALLVPGERWLQRLALTAVVTLAAALRLANLAALGYANHYYTAAVVAMLQSWHNFFFVAAEPGGAVSVDKPPVGLWLQAISAYFFGVNGFGVLLPQIIAGLLSVVVVYHLVRRQFGTIAGLVAALALALTPVVVATDRNNTMDSTLILTLLLAAGAFIQATETTRLRHLLLGAVLVGIGFNIKMLQAYLPLPAFYALYFLGSAERLWRKIGKLALATVLLLAISLAWAVAVDLTPVEQRPYVGSSSDNSELSLIAGYNGLQRLLGMGGRGGLLSGLLGRVQDGGARDGNSNFQPPPGFQPPQGQNGNGNFQPLPGVQPPPGQSRNGGVQSPQGFQPPQRPGPLGGPGGGGFPGTGTPSPLRLFTAPLSKEMSWLLPFGIFSALLLALRSRPRWPLAPKHQALVLWGGWLLSGGIFFSIAGFFHEYYLAMLAPPLAALVGIGVVELWGVWERRPWLGSAWLLMAAAGTLWFQFTTASAFINSVSWLPFMVALFAIGAALLIGSMTAKLHGAAQGGFGCVVAALLVTPGIWSGLTNLNASTNQSLPAAYSGRVSFGPVGRGGADTNLTGLQINPALLAYLEANTQGTTYLMAVPSAMQGADYVIASGHPVLYLGGFNGSDQVETADSLAQLVAQGKLRYIYWDGRRGPGLGGQASISAWVTASCKVVQGFDTPTENFGAPDGTNAGSMTGGGFARGPDGMQVTLYECGT